MLTLAKFSNCHWKISLLWRSSRTWLDSFYFSFNSLQPLIVLKISLLQFLADAFLILEILQFNYLLHYKLKAQRRVLFLSLEMMEHRVSSKKRICLNLFSINFHKFSLCVPTILHSVAVSEIRFCWKISQQIYGFFMLKKFFSPLNSGILHHLTLLQNKLNRNQQQNYSNRNPSWISTLQQHHAILSFKTAFKQLMWLILLPYVHIYFGFFV